MNDDKITISMDEVNHATPVPGSTPPPIFTSGYVPSETDQEQKPKRTGVFIGIGIAAVAVLCITVIGAMAFVDGRTGDNDPTKIREHPPSNERTVSDYRAEVIRDVEEELSKPYSKLKKRVEDAHLTVTVKSTRIVWCDVTTIDGSDKAGKDDSNIARVSMLIRFTWEGFIDKGYTDLHIVYDVKNDRLEKSEIDHTTALVNVEDPTFWYGVGTIIGSML